MAIKTSTLGGVTLTGGAAKAFKKQFLDNPFPPSEAAKKALKAGKKIVRELKKNGYAKIIVSR